MMLSLQAPVVALEPGEVFSLDDASGTRIHARSGVVWVTYENSAADLILERGQSLVVARGGRAVVQALQPACVALQ